MKEIPQIDLRQQDPKIKNEIDRALQNVIEHGKFVENETVRKFERAFAESFQFDFCLGVNSGATAVYLALRALEIGKGDEVITAANAPLETVCAICRTGAKIRFVDINPFTLNIDVAKIERTITYNTKAILLVHRFGQPAELKYVLKLAKRHGLFLVEDATQACGASYYGKPIGAFGDLACFGFDPESNLGAFGAAGAVVAKSKALSAKLRTLIYSKTNGSIHNFDQGFNYRMDAIQAAVLLVKLKHLAAWNEERRRIATVYHGYFKKNERIQTITEPDGLYSVYLQYVVQIENRDEVRQKLAEDGIGTGRPSSEPMHKYPAFEHFVIGEKRFRVAESVASRLLSLPIYPHLTNTVVENAAMKVIEIVDSI